MPEMQTVFDLIYGHWNSRILEAGVALGVFDALSSEHPQSAETVATAIGADARLLYRLMRAMANLGLLAEGELDTFHLTPMGALFQSDHPSMMRSLTLLEGNLKHRSGWNYLAEMVRDGKQDGALREFGSTSWEQMNRDPEYSRVFQDAMVVFSRGEVGDVLDAVREGKIDLSGVTTFCDIAGGVGALLAAVLEAHPSAVGTCFDLPDVVAEGSKRTASTLGGRLSFASGDMFQAVPPADCYFLKNILHDWGDDKCVAILSNARQAATGPRLMMVCEMVIPAPETPHYSKLLDINMLCATEGRQRTAEEFKRLLSASGWKMQQIASAAGHLTSVMAASATD